MRIVKEIVQAPLKISIFSWNQKYLIKYENGPLEQTYKVDELDVISEADLDIFLTDEFILRVKEVFNHMNAAFGPRIAEL